MRTSSKLLKKKKFNPSNLVYEENIQSTQMKSSFSSEVIEVKKQKKRRREKKNRKEWNSLILPQKVGRRCTSRTESLE